MNPTMYTGKGTRRPTFADDMQLRQPSHRFPVRHGPPGHVPTTGHPALVILSPPPERLSLHDDTMRYRYWTIFSSSCWILWLLPTSNGIPCLPPGA